MTSRETLLADPPETSSACEDVLRRARCADDYVEFAQLCRARKKLAARGAWTPPGPPLRLALLGGATTELLEAPLALALETAGLSPTIHASDYNALAYEILDAESATAAFEPEVAVIVSTPANLPTWPPLQAGQQDVAALVEQTCQYWLGLCERLHARTGCDVVLNNFHPLPARPLGNLGPKVPGDPNNFLQRLNLRLGDAAPPYVHINDVAGLAASLGVANWFDARYWYHAKQPVSFQCLVPYVRNTARIIGALRGRTCKCLVLDLDNTLWGGVVGDDGLDGIKIGQGDPVGEAFADFQRYAQQLKQRGVLLAVCSKNEEENALAPFARHPEMILRRDDFVAFQANWDPKPDNLRRIAAEMNIGLDSLVFVDDNPAERAHVRQRLPEVTVIELGDDPADYVRILDRAGCFEIVRLSEEDLQRTAQYQANSARLLLEESMSQYADYLQQLEQQAVVGAFEELHFDRITQLANKSNQFNLTTKRMSRAEVAAWAGDADRLTLTVRLRDRFGDNGLISVFSARREGHDFEIEQWLMSCRVLKRGVEQLVCNVAAEQARRRGARRLKGTYLPTAKNKLVADHYQKLGFEQLPETAGGITRWTLDLERFTPLDVAIRLVESY